MHTAKIKTAIPWHNRSIYSVAISKQADQSIIHRLDQACSVKIAECWPNSFLCLFIIWKKNPIFFPDTVSNPKQTRCHHLVCFGDQSQQRIWFILPPYGVSNIIDRLTWVIFRLSREQNFTPDSTQSVLHWTDLKG